MTDDTIPVTPPPLFFETRGGRIAARGFGTVAQIVPDNVSTEDARRMMQIIVDALNREFMPRHAPTPSAAPISLRGEVR